MLRSRHGLVLAILLSSLTAAAAQTSSPTTPPPAHPADKKATGGLGPATHHPGQIDKGQNMILPSAGRSKELAAPTMVYDCARNPQDCTTPASPSDKAGAPAHSAPTKP